MADVDRANAAFDALLNELTSLGEWDPPWLDIATELLTFCHKFAPSPGDWILDEGEPWRKIAEIEMRVAGELTAVDRASGQQSDHDDRDGPQLNAKPVVSSFATRDHLRALCDAAKRERDLQPFGDKRMLSLAVVARGLAGAIDNLVGRSYLDWFRSRDKVTITHGEPYPVCSHDPRPWLNDHAANTDPKSQPRRELSYTPRLRIATDRPQFEFVLDFTFWDRLSPLGSRDGLAIAAAQPNLDLTEFDIRLPPQVPPNTYRNHGPKGAAQQVDRIMRLVDEATAQGAEVVLVPEYAVSEPVHTDLMKWFKNSSTVPIVFCAGMARGPDNQGYMKNEAWLLVSTSGIEQGYPVHFHAKTFRAKLVINKQEYEERIRVASEVRVFVSQEWSLSVLICLEAMAGQIIDQLALIGTNLLLVPSMSEKTGTMVGTMSRLCNASQAFVVMGNGPASYLNATTATRCEAFFAGPYAANPSSWLAPLADEKRQPDEITAWVFRASQKTVTPHPLPVDNS